MKAKEVHHYTSKRKGRDHFSPFHHTTGRHLPTLFLYALVKRRRVICLTVLTGLRLVCISLCVSSWLKDLRKLVLTVWLTVTAKAQ